jgi:hypothetical protein
MKFLFSGNRKQELYMRYRFILPVFLLIFSAGAAHSQRAHAKPQKNEWVRKYLEPSLGMYLGNDAPQRSFHPRKFARNHRAANDNMPAILPRRATTEPVVIRMSSKTKDNFWPDAQPKEIVPMEYDNGDEDLRQSWNNILEFTGGILDNIRDNMSRANCK